MKDFSKFGTLLTKEEAKKVRGGKNCPVCGCNPCICPDGGPANWAECCMCAFEIFGVLQRGWICGNYGDPDCSKGIAQLEQMPGIGSFICAH